MQMSFVMAGLENEKTTVAKLREYSNLKAELKNMI